MATTTWTDGAGDGLWASAGNWSAGLPASGDTAYFNMAATVSLGSSTLSNPAILVAASVLVTITTGTITIDAGGVAGLSVLTDAELVVDVPIIGSGSILKTGTGTLVLAEANTYADGITLAGGTVNAGNQTALGAGAVTVAPGTTLQFGSAASGKATLGGTLTIDGGTLRIGG